MRINVGLNGTKQSGSGFYCGEIGFAFRGTVGIGFGLHDTIGLYFRFHGTMATGPGNHGSAGIVFALDGTTRLVFGFIVL